MAAPIFNPGYAHDSDNRRLTSGVIAKASSSQRRRIKPVEEAIERRQVVIPRADTTYRSASRLVLGHVKAIPGTLEPRRLIIHVNHTHVHAHLHGPASRNVAV